MNFHKNDFRIGLLVVVPMVVLVGVLIFNNLDALQEKRTLRLGLNNIEGVAEGTDVLLNGYRIGKVQAVRYCNRTPNGGAEERPRRRPDPHACPADSPYDFVMTLAVRADVPVWAGTTATVTPKLVGGNSSIDLTMPERMEDRSRLLGPDELIEARAGVNLGSLVKGVADTLPELQQSLGQLSSLLDQVERLTATEGQDLGTLFADLVGMVGEVGELLGSVDRDLDRTVASLNTDLVALGRALESLDTALRGVASLADQGTVLFENVDGLVVDLDATLGSVGELLGDGKTEVPDLMGALNSAEAIIDDVRVVARYLERRPSALVFGVPKKLKEEIREEVQSEDGE
jgi:ABC-type transporter Mla subunit MlaD